MEGYASLPLVQECMDLFRQAAELYSAANDPRHEAVRNSIFHLDHKLRLRVFRTYLSYVSFAKLCQTVSSFMPTRKILRCSHKLMRLNSLSHSVPSKVPNFSSHFVSLVEKVSHYQHCHMNSRPTFSAGADTDAPVSAETRGHRRS